MTRALVIGGTGPTGIPLVQGLVDRGYDVTIVHRGLHERSETPAAVAHIHTDPYDDDALRTLLDDQTFDVVVAMYGRLRRIAELTAGRVGQFVSVGGVPAYPRLDEPVARSIPRACPVPVGEGAPTVDRPEDDEKGYRIVRTEQAVFAHHPRAAHFRYPYVYGPHQLVPREWLIVRRILDGRDRIVVADDGLTLHHHGYTENLAHALLLAVDQPDAAAGKLFNIGDEEVLSIRQVIELIAAALSAPPRDHVDAVRARGAGPPAARATAADASRARHRPRPRPISATATWSRRAPPLAATARWLVDNPCPPGGQEELVLTDPFDYAAEDRLIDAWLAATRALPDPGFATAPGYGLAYSGPGGRPRSNEEFDA